MIRAGFPAPRVFLDGDSDRKLPFVNWMMALVELFLREPKAEIYAIFQDDIGAVSNLREYLDANPWPANGYANLYVHPDNAGAGKGCGWRPSDQKGKGALALCFERSVAARMLGNEYLWRRPEHPTRGWRFIDGGVIEAARKIGLVEYVHYPSLVRHTGTVSTMTKAESATAANALINKGAWSGAYVGAGYPGDGFNAMELLK